MKKLIFLLFCFWGVLYISCHKKEVNKEKTITNTFKIAPKEVSQKGKTIDSINQILQRSLQLDSLEIVNSSPFLYIKIGYILSSITKNALIFSPDTDSTLKVVLFTQIEDKWTKNDELTGLETCFPHFMLEFKDYNFDKQKDIYLACTISNGYALSRGYLFTIHPKTKKLTINLEARELANMSPDNKSKTVISEEIYHCKEDGGMPKICYKKNKWINGKLKGLNNKCLCPRKNY